MGFSDKNDIRRQIDEDIKGYQESFSYIPNIEKDDWAFNFWVLDKLFCVDSDLIPELIIDFSDEGIDCYVWREDTEDLFLIQNKYYDDNTTLTTHYVEKNVLAYPISSLEAGTYSHSKELQQIYSKYKEDESFSVYQNIYITNDSVSESIITAVEKYNTKPENACFTASIFQLADIGELYFGDTNNVNPEFIATVETEKTRTALNLDPQSYGLKQKINARYSFTPIINLYEIMCEAKIKKYNMFDENIREYLGTGVQVNKMIVKTLKDSSERENFFYYNNGITIICETMSKIATIGGQKPTFSIKNPQIVNGCQTVSSIMEVLSSWSPDRIRADFGNVYLMVKILVIPDKSEEMKQLYQNIVLYNNSQNQVNDKQLYSATNSSFNRLKEDFESKGFLLCVKQSDRYQYCHNKYKNSSELLKRSSYYRSLFTLDLKRTRDFTINLVDFLQVIIAFVGTSQQATQKKSNLLVSGSDQNSQVMDFIHKIENGEVTTDSLLYLYLLWKRSEQEKRNMQDENKGKIPASFLMIDGFAHFDCGNDASIIKNLLGNKEKIDSIIKLYTIATSMYYQRYLTDHPGKAYNDMMKEEMSYPLMNESIKTAKTMMQTFA